MNNTAHLPPTVTLLSNNESGNVLMKLLSREGNDGEPEEDFLEAARFSADGKLSAQNRVTTIGPAGTQYTANGETSDSRR